VKIIWPPINAEKIQGDDVARVPGRRVLSVGRLVRRKGFDTLISAVARLRAEFPDIRLWIVGDGSERPLLNRWCRALSLQEQSFIKGEVSGEELSSFTGSAMCCLSHIVMENGDCEGSPTVLIEASAYSSRSIAGDGTGAERHGQSWEYRYLVDAANLGPWSDRWRLFCGTRNSL